MVNFNENKKLLKISCQILNTTIFLRNSNPSENSNYASYMYISFRFLVFGMRGLCILEFLKAKGVGGSKYGSRPLLGMDIFWNNVFMYNQCFLDSWSFRKVQGMKIAEAFSRIKGLVLGKLTGCDHEFVSLLSAP